MAKKKSKKAAVDVIDYDEQIARVDDMMESAWDDLGKFAGKKNVSLGVSDIPKVLPLPSLALRYLYQNEGFILSRVHQIVGPEASYKSTFLNEILRWFRLCGGRGGLMLAETKDNDELRNSMLNWDSDWLRVENCKFMDDWQKLVLKGTEIVKKRCEMAGGPGKTVPICWGVDSLTGKLLSTSVDKIMEEGFAGKTFPAEASSITRYCQSYSQMLLDWPICLVGVNHCKKSMQMGAEEDNIPGGRELAYQCGTIVHMDKSRVIELADNATLASVYMRTIKNSYGKPKRRIGVDIRFWYEKVMVEHINEDSGEVTQKEGRRLYSRFEWWAASIRLLMGEFFNETTSKRLTPAIKEVIDVHEKACGSYGKMYWSNALGVPSSDPIPAHDLGVMLELRGDLLEGLYRALTIARRDYFMPSVEYLARQPAYAHIKVQAIEAGKAVAAMRAAPGVMAQPPIRRMDEDDDDE